MKAVDVKYLPELATLAQRLEGLWGWDTQLYVEMGKHSVWDDGVLIGHFQWVEELETVVFRPTEV